MGLDCLFRVPLRVKFGILELLNPGQSAIQPARN